MPDWLVSEPFWTMCSVIEKWMVDAVDPTALLLCGAEASPMFVLSTFIRTLRKALLPEVRAVAMLSRRSLLDAEPENH